MTAPLSYTSQFGYYGLRVNPSFDQVIGTIRKPLRIPLPERSAKWYALSPYRALILDSAQKYNDYEHMKLDYRSSGNQAPEQAAHLRHRRQEMIRCGKNMTARTKPWRKQMPMSLLFKL